MNYEKEFEDFFNENYEVLNSRNYLKSIAYDCWKHGHELQHKPEPKKEKIELVGGDWYVTGGDCKAFKCYGDSVGRWTGRQRKTQDDAEKAAIAMRKRDRQAAFVYEHCGHDGSWGPSSCHYIRINPSGKYVHNIDSCMPDLCKIYMPIDTAEWLCDNLNSGEIEL